MKEASTLHFQDLKGRIESLISNTEMLFLSFGKTFPTFVEELHKSLEASQYSVTSIGNGISIENAMQDLFGYTHEIIDQSSSRFSEIHTKDMRLLDSLGNAIKSLGNMDRVIYRIRDDSIEMELISLNAMTVALKSGHAGKAFSVITDELKRLSSRTILLTDQLTQKGKMILGYFTKYRGEVEKLEETQEALFQGLDERVQSSFIELENRIKQVGLDLEAMIDESRKVEAPVHAIMETVQLQDIIKQSLDHILVALQELDDSELDTQIEPEDAAAFRKTLAALSDSILQDVYRSLAGARQRFHTEAASIQAVINGGEKWRGSLLHEAFGSGKEGLVSTSFEETSAMLRDMESHVADYIKMKLNLAESGKRLYLLVEGLEQHFRTFNKILNRFRTIDIASRIEVSKQEVLRSINDTVTEMSILIDRIGEDVKEAITITQDFTKETKDSVLAYESSSIEESSIFGSIGKNLRVSHEKLSGLRDSIQKGIEDFSLFTPEFLELLLEGEKQIEGIDAVLDECTSVSTVLRTIKEEAMRELVELGVGEQYTDVHSSRLKEIISRFTIYAHKKVAVELSGIHMDFQDVSIDEDLESDVEAGDITYF